MPKQNRYQITGELGSGGMGKVYQAIDTNLKRTVALKVLTAKDPKNVKIVERFFREARSIAQLTHPNIIRFYDFGCEHNVHYYTMAYIEGATLDQWMHSKKIGLRKIATLLCKVASAVHYAHQAGIIHRDLFIFDLFA